jgi:putative peptidoglycan lipid II flippase
MVSEGKTKDFRDTLSSSINLVFLMTLPSACGLIVLGEPIIRLLYSHGGAFHEADVPMTAWALTGYAIGLTGYAAIKVLSPAFYAMDDAKTPMVIAIISIAVNLTASYLLGNFMSRFEATPEFPGGLRHVGVALATSCVALINFFALAWFMRRKISRLNGKAIFLSFIKIAAASAVLSVVCYVSFHFLTNYFPKKPLSVKLIEAFVPIALGGIAFIVVAKILRVHEMEQAFASFRRKLSR